MTEKELSDAIKFKCSELTTLMYDAAICGLFIKLTVSTDNMIGVRADIVNLDVTITKEV